MELERQGVRTHISADNRFHSKLSTPGHGFSHERTEFHPSNKFTNLLNHSSRNLEFVVLIAVI